MAGLVGSGARVAPLTARLPPRAAVWVRGAIGVAAFLAIAEVVTRAELVNPAYLPPASQIVLQTARLLVDPEFLAQVGATMSAWAIGLGITILIAVPLGVALGSSQAAYTASRALIEFLRPIPSVALIPLVILLLGQGLQMKLALIIYASLWPVLFNTIYGIHDVDPVAKDTARSFGFGRVAILFRVSLPSAAPFVATGVRIASAIALILAISAELLAGGNSGIGWWMQRVQAGGGNAGLVYGAVMITGLLGVGINLVLTRLERRFLAWQPALREGG